MSDLEPYRQAIADRDKELLTATVEARNRLESLQAALGQLRLAQRETEAAHAAAVDREQEARKTRIQAAHDNSLALKAVYAAQHAVQRAQKDLERIEKQLEAQ